MGIIPIVLPTEPVPSPVFKIRDFHWFNFHWVGPALSMLHKALRFLEKQLNNEISVPGQPASVVLTSILNEKGELNIQGGELALMLVNVEEERTLKNQVPRERRMPDNSVQFANPEIKLNLFIVLASNPASGNYGNALEIVSKAVTFFQGTSSFDNVRYPELAPEIERLVLELYTLTLEQQNQLWTSLGAKYLPSVVYKIRLIVIDHALFGPIIPVVRTIDNRLELIK